MIIRRSTLESVLPAAQAKDHTSRFNRLEIRPDGTITATDGKILLSAIEHTRMPDEDYPNEGSQRVPKYTGDAPGVLILPVDDAKQLLKTAQKESSRRSLPILSTIQVGMNGDGAYAAATDLQSTTTVRLLGPDQAHGGAFPKWDQIVPALGRPAVTLTLGAEVLRALAEAATKAEAGGSETAGMVTLHVPTEAKYQGNRESDHVFDGDKRTGAGCSCEQQHTGNQWMYIDGGGNGAVESPIRIEIQGREVAIVGALAVCRRPK